MAGDGEPEEKGKDSNDSSTQKPQQVAESNANRCEVTAGKRDGGDGAENGAEHGEEAGEEAAREGADSQGQGRRHYKKRKVALFVAYKGAGYQGMQRNPGARTIEGALEKALFRAGAILEDDLGDWYKIGWMRAARTDKGVSALGQVVSARLVIEPEGFLERLNGHLPKQIRALGCVRVTASFNAKDQCDRRRYEYYLPAFAFDPWAHRDRDSEAGAEPSIAAGSVPADAAPGSAVPAVATDPGAAAAPQADPGEARNASTPSKVPESIFEGVNGSGSGEASSGGLQEGTAGAEGRGEPLPKRPRANIPTPAQDPEATCEGACASSTLGGARTELIPAQEEAFPGRSVEEDGTGGIAAHSKESEMEAALQAASDAPAHAQSREDAGEASRKVLVPPQVVSASDKEGKIQEAAGSMPGASVKSGFVFDASCMERLNLLLGQYKGTRCFHNYTAGVSPYDSAAQRYIVSFEAAEVVEVEGVPLVRMVVVGQSFLLHQIRKMVGMAVAIMRGHAPPSLLTDAFRKDKRINVPMAPELGLFLAECMYHSYNRKWGKSHEEVSLGKWQTAVDDFRKNVILPHIVGTEKQEHTVAHWLSNLNDRNYKDFALARAEAQGIL